MEFIRLFKEIMLMLLISKTSWSISVEPKYTKFMYEEQLLEKMVRLELFVDNMGNNTKKFISDSTTVLQEIQNSTKSELKKVVDRMDRLELDMDSFRKNVTSTLVQSSQTNSEWRVNTGTTFEEQIAQANTLTTEILRNFQAFKSDLMGLYNKDRQDMMAWINATAGSLDIPNRMDEVKTSLENVHLFLLSDCSDIKKELPSAASGAYFVSLWKTKQQVEILCDMDTDGGGWTIFQKRFNGSVDFYRTFKEYEDGFGQIDGEFWLGLKTIQEIAANGKSELRIDMTAADDSHAHEVFQNFSLSAGPKYTLHIGPATVKPDNQGLSYNNGYNFYTRDNDNRNKCADLDHGGWWYNHCAYANLNGDYVTPGTQFKKRPERGVTYRSFKGTDSLKSTVMMMRRLSM